MVIENGSKMGVPKVIAPINICSGNVKINTLYCSYIFNTKHGLKLPDDFDMAALMAFNDEGTLEER